MFYHKKGVMNKVDKLFKRIKRVKDFLLWVTRNKRRKTGTLEKGMMLSTYNDDIVKVEKSPQCDIIEKLEEISQDKNIDECNKKEIDDIKSRIMINHLCSNCYYYMRGCSKQCGSQFGKLYFKLVKEQKFTSRDVSAFGERKF